MATPTFAQAGGSIQPYGCADSTPGSLVHVGGLPFVGAVLQLGVDNPLGTQLPGSLAFLYVTTSPDSAGPCGTPIPGLGMGGGPGELLVDLTTPKLIVGAASWPGVGQLAQLDLAIPNYPILIGTHIFAQGVLLDLVGPLGMTLTQGLDIPLSAAGPPDLEIAAAYLEHFIADPGETLAARVVVRNAGGGTSIPVEVQVDLGVGASSLIVIPPIGAGLKHELTVPFPTDATWKTSNPHFLTATVDPSNLIAEADELDNVATAKKPAFVVDVHYAVTPPVFEHDDVIEILNGVKISHTTVSYGPGGAPSDNLQLLDVDKGTVAEPQPGSVPDQVRIHPDVAAADAAAQPGELVEYIVQYDHGALMPRLPVLPDRTNRFSPVNVQVFEHRMALLEGTRRARESAASQLVFGLEAAGGKALEYFALGGAMRVEAPKGYLATFDATPQVVHVEPLEMASTLGTTSTARALLQSDPYYSGGATGSGYIAVIDSGVRASHDLLSSPDHLDFVEDCVSGDSNCNDTGSSFYDGDYDELDHGTAVTAIITGNSNYGNSYRGFSAGTVDSWKVHATGAGSTLSSSAILRAIDQAAYWGDHLANMSFGSDAGPTGTTAEACDDLFEAGCAVFAANGNDGGGSGTVDSPACAHKVIGVGAYDVDSLADASYQSDGPTSDSRYKPDLQAPTNSVTARAGSDSDLGSFGGTSSATPTVVGAASVFSDWFSLSSASTADAGKVYAALLNGGDREWGEFNNTRGVGPFELPLSGKFYMGSRNVGNHDNDYVTIDVPSGATGISAAIWWPEKPSHTHRDIDLYLQKPSGSTSDKSLSVNSVFEHLEVGSPATGTRKVKLYGYDVPLFKTQTVYYAIFIQS